MERVKERPILFSGEMVRAILEGRKTQTRRTCKPHLQDYERVTKSYRDQIFDFHFIDDIGQLEKCPYGKIGDQLYVRETWRVGAWSQGAGDPYHHDYGLIAVDYNADNFIRKEWLRTNSWEQYEKLYTQSIKEAKAAGIKRDPTYTEEYFVWEPGNSPCRWRPSIFMPRWASRIQLEITDIRVERVQDIEPHDILSEGVQTEIPAILKGSEKPEEYEKWSEQRKEEYIKSVARAHYIAECHYYNNLKLEFMILWNSINAKRGFSWESNPWVWVVEFRRIK